jgi:VanZ family protein
MKSSTLKYSKAFLPAIVWALIIYFLSSQQVLPALSLSVIDFVLKKTAHIFVYAILYILIIKGFTKLNYPFEKIWFNALLICLLYAIFDEIHQSTVIGRTATVTDVGFDFLGASVVALHKFGYL